MTKKNILTAAVSLSLVACLSIGATLAYFTDKTDVQTNTFKAGNVDVTLIDQFDKTTTPKGSYVFDNHGVQTGIEYTNVVPGDVLDKDVSLMVRNGSANAHLAILVTVDNTKNINSDDVYDMVDEAVLRLNNGAMWQEGKTVTTTDGVTGKLYVYNPNYTGADWTKGVPANTVVNLFSDIEIPAEWGNAYANAEFDIKVRGYAIQAEHLDVTDLENAITNNESDIEFEQYGD